MAEFRHRNINNNADDISQEVDPLLNEVIHPLVGKEVNYAGDQGGIGKESKEIADKKLAKTVFPVVFISLLLDLLAFTIILPLLPSILDYYSRNDSSNLYKSVKNFISNFQERVGAPDRYTSVLFGGLLGSVFSFLQFLVSPIVGGLSDYYGRKPIMIMCAIGIALSYLVWTFSMNFTIFVFSRIIGGISKGNIALNMSIITDASDAKGRGRGMALVGIAFSIGFIVGPSIGALFTTYAKQANYWFLGPSLCALTLALLDLLVIIFALKETLPKEKRAKTFAFALKDSWMFLNIFKIFSFAAVRNISHKNIKTLRRLGFVYFLYLFLYSALEFTVTFLMFHKFQYTAMDQAHMFLTTGIVMAFLQGGIVRRIPEAYIKRCAIMSLYLLVPAFIIVGMAESSAMLYFGMILYAISTAFAVTCLTTLVSTFGKDDQKGTVIGIFRSLGAFGRALGPVFGSTAFWILGSQTTYTVGGILLIIPAFLLHSTNIQK